MIGRDGPLRSSLAAGKHDRFRAVPVSALFEGFMVVGLDVSPEAMIATSLQTMPQEDELQFYVNESCSLVVRGCSSISLPHLFCV